MIFLTVGTMPMQFDRLVKSIDAVVKKSFIKEVNFVQIGFSIYKSRFVRYVDMLEKTLSRSIFKKPLPYRSRRNGDDFDGARIQQAFISDVMPRMKKYGEHVKDHQIATAHYFEKDGHVLAAYQIDDILSKPYRVRLFCSIKSFY